MHHIAVESLANIFVNIFYIAFEDNPRPAGGDPLSDVRVYLWTRIR
jgi:hypothetical protein